MIEAALTEPLFVKSPAVVVKLPSLLTAPALVIVSAAVKVIFAAALTTGSGSTPSSVALVGL